MRPVRSDWRSPRVAAGDGAAQGRRPGKAGQSPIGCCPRPLCLMVDWCLVAGRGGRQIPHGERKLGVPLVLNGQTRQLGQEEADLGTSLSEQSYHQCD